MKKVILFMVAICAALMVNAETIVGTINKAIPEGWTYITNDAKYPDPAFYSNGGLKINYEGIGIKSPSFAQVSDATVTLNIAALNENQKTGTSDNAITVKGVDAAGVQIAVATIGKNDVVKGNNTFQLSGNGFFTSVEVIMTGYPNNGKKYCNIELSSVTITTGEGTTPGGDDEKPGDVIEMTINNGWASYYEEFSEEGAYNFEITLIKVSEEDFMIEAPYLSFDCFMPTAKSLVGTYSMANGTIGKEYTVAYLTEEEVYGSSEGHEMTDAELIIKCIDQDEFDNYIYSVEANFTIEGKKYHFTTETGLSVYKQLDTDNDGYYEDEEVYYEIVEDITSAINNLEVDKTISIQNGKIFCDGNARIYNAKGMDVTGMNGNLEGIFIVKNGNKVSKVSVKK